jgi:hypothetical protein
VLSFLSRREKFKDSNGWIFIQQSEEMLFSTHRHGTLRLSACRVSCYSRGNSLSFTISLVPFRNANTGLLLICNLSNTLWGNKNKITIVGAYI